MLDVLALGIIIPVLPQLVSRFVGGDMQQAAIVFGAFVSVWEAMQLLFSPLLGSLSDRYGRRSVILLSNLGLGLDYVLMALAPSLPLLFLGRIISGITAASFPAATAFIADVMPPEKRAQGFGMIGAAFGVGFIVGPAVGGLLGGFDARAPFWVAAAFSLANAGWGYFVLPESLAPENRMAFSWKRANPLGSLKLLRRHRELFGLSMSVFLMNLAHFVYQSTFVLYADYRYHWKERAVGLTLAAVGLSAGIVQGALAGRVTAALGERRTMIVALLFGVAGFVLYGYASTGTLFMIGVPIMALWGLAGPAMQSQMSRQLGPSEQGQLQGAVTSLNAIAGLVGPAMFTRAFAWGIEQTKLGSSFTNAVGAPFFISAALLLAAMFVGAYATRSTIQTREESPPVTG